MIRDEELKRLESYAKGLGVKITKKKGKRFDPGAAWVVDGSEIILFVSPRDSKTTLILRLIHELAHHKGWINNGRKQDLNTNQALILDDERNNRKDPPLPKKQRKLIYETEKNDMQYWDEIIREVNIKIRSERIKLEKEMDLWTYVYYVKNGKYPTGTQTKQQRKDLKKKGK